MSKKSRRAKGRKIRKMLAKAAKRQNIGYRF